MKNSARFKTSRIEIKISYHLDAMITCAFSLHYCLLDLLQRETAELNLLIFKSIYVRINRLIKQVLLSLTSNRPSNHP